MLPIVALSILIARADGATIATAFPAGVIATGTQGTTNPPAPTMGTPINQSSMARLLSLNSIDDWCVFAPPQRANISDTETEEVAWCTKPRNNARVIPDGTITGLTFLKTPFYIQLMGVGNLTMLNIEAGDMGGELDPHGQFGDGNPIGGNVTTNALDPASDPVNIEEWMLFISSAMFCIRACTNANATYSAAQMCEARHKLDVMGCEFVMPGTYRAPGTFETCDADVAYPPGWYPNVLPDGSTSFSKFAQYFTGVYTGGDGQPTSYTVGDLITPTAPASVPSSSNCVTAFSIANGIPLTSLGVTGSMASASTSATKPSATSAGTRVGKAGTGSEYAAIVLVSVVFGAAAVFLLH
ncbi:hypothetical protein MKEN_00188300 [Mycena kentingensis (nom. inval.)]|nr:hypothetical protein MKEN_00188300 [Mycena kentingensis (nom. inval.)]